MPTQIELLAEVQITDQRLREKDLQIDRLQQRMRATQEALTAKRAAVAALRNEFGVYDAQRRALEAELTADEVRIKDKRMRLNRIRNERELQALRREIDARKELNAQREEDLLGLLERCEERGRLLKEQEGELASLEATATSQVESDRAAVEQLRAELAEERQRRQELAAGLDQELRRRYEMVFARRGGLAVVEVRDSTCLGCHMHIRPQLVNEIQRQERVITCPSCHRILFVRPEEEPRTER